MDKDTSLGSLYADSTKESSTGVVNEGKSHDEINIDCSKGDNTRVVIEGNGHDEINAECSKGDNTGIVSEGIEHDEINTDCSKGDNTGFVNDGEEHDDVITDCSKGDNSGVVNEGDKHDEINTDCSKQATTGSSLDEEEHNKISEKKEIETPQEFQIEQKESTRNDVVLSSDKDNIEHDVTQGDELTTENVCKSETENKQVTSEAVTSKECDMKDTITNMDEETAGSDKCAESTVDQNEQMEEDISGDQDVSLNISVDCSEIEKGLRISNSEQNISKDESQTDDIDRKDSQGMPVDIEMNKKEENKTTVNSKENTTKENIQTETSSLEDSTEKPDLQGNSVDTQFKMEVNQSTNSAEKDTTKGNDQTEISSQKESPEISNLQGISVDMESNKMEINQSIGKNITITEETTSSNSSTDLSNSQGMANSLEMADSQGIADSQGMADSHGIAELQEMANSQKIADSHEMTDSQGMVDLESDKMEVEQSNEDFITEVDTFNTEASTERSNSQEVMMVIESDKMEYDQIVEPDDEDFTKELTPTEVQEKHDQLQIATDKKVQETSVVKSSKITKEKEPNYVINEKCTGEQIKLHPLCDDSKPKSIDDKSSSSKLSFASSTSPSPASSSSSSVCTFTLNKNIFAELKSKCTKDSIKLSPKSAHQKDKALSLNETIGEHKQTPKMESERNIFSIFENRLGKEKLDVNKKAEGESTYVQEAGEGYPRMSKKDCRKSEEINKISLPTHCDKIHGNVEGKESCIPHSAENTGIDNDENSEQKEQTEENIENICNKYNEINDDVATSVETTQSDLPKRGDDEIFQESVERKNIQVVREDNSRNEAPSPGQEEFLNELGIRYKNIAFHHQSNVDEKENVAQDKDMELDKIYHLKDTKEVENIQEKDIEMSESFSSQSMVNTEDNHALSSSTLNVKMDINLESVPDTLLETSNEIEEESVVVTDSVIDKHHLDDDKHHESVSERLPRDTCQQSLLDNVSDEENVLCDSKDVLEGNLQNRVDRTESITLSDKKEVYEHLMYEAISSDEEDETSNENVSECEIGQDIEKEQLLSKEMKEKEMISETIENSDNMEMSETVLSESVESSGNVEMSETVLSESVESSKNVEISETVESDSGESGGNVELSEIVQSESVESSGNVEISETAQSESGESSGNVEMSEIVQSESGESGGNVEMSEIVQSEPVESSGNVEISETDQSETVDNSDNMEMSETVQSETVENSDSMEMSETVHSETVTGKEDLQDVKEAVMFNEQSVSEPHEKISKTKDENLDDEKSAIDFKVMDGNEGSVKSESVEIKAPEESDNLLQPIVDMTKMLESDILESKLHEMEEEHLALEITSSSSEEHEKVSIVNEKEVSKHKIERSSTKELEESSEDDQEGTMSVYNEELTVEKQELICTVDKQNVVDFVDEEEEQQESYNEQHIDTNQSSYQDVIDASDVDETKKNFKKDQNLSETTAVEYEVSPVGNSADGDEHMACEDDKNLAQEDQHIPTEESIVGGGVISENENLRSAECDMSLEIKSEDYHNTGIADGDVLSNENEDLRSVECEISLEIKLEDTGKDINIVSAENVSDTAVEEEICTEQNTGDNDDTTETSTNQQEESNFEKNEIHCYESVASENQTKTDNKQMLLTSKEDETNIDVYEDSRSPPVLFEITEEMAPSQGNDRMDDEEYDSPPSLSVISPEDVIVKQTNLPSDEVINKTEVVTTSLDFDSQNVDGDKEPDSEEIQIDDDKEEREMINEENSKHAPNKQNIDTASGSKEYLVSVTSHENDFVRNLESTESSSTVSHQGDDDKVAEWTKIKSGNNINDEDMENNRNEDEKSSTDAVFGEQFETKRETKNRKEKQDEIDKELQREIEEKRLDDVNETNNTDRDKDSDNKADQNKSGSSSSNIGLQELKQLFQFITSASNIKNDKEDDANKEENENVEAETLVCKICDEQFDTKEDMNSHIQACHSESVEGDSENVDGEAEKDSENESNETKSLPANCVPFLYLMQKWLSQELDIEEEVDGLYSIDERADFIRGFYQNCSYDQKMRLVSELSAIPTQLLTLSFDPSHSVSGLLPNIECEMGCCQEEDLRLKTFIDYALYPSLLVEHLEIQRNHQHGQFPLVLAEPHCHDVKVDSEMQYENETDVENINLKNDNSYIISDKGCEDDFKESENQLSQEYIDEEMKKQDQNNILCENEEIVVCQPEGTDSFSDDSEDESLAVLSKKLKEKNNKQKRKRENDLDTNTKKKRKGKSEKKEKKNDKKKLKVVKAKNKNKLTIKIVKKMKDSDKETTKPKKKPISTEEEETKQNEKTSSSNVQIEETTVSEENEKDENIQSEENAATQPDQKEQDGKGKSKKTIGKKRKKDSDSADDKNKKDAKKMKTTGTYITKKMQKTLEKNKVVAAKTAFEGVSSKISTNVTEDINKETQNPTQNITETVENTSMDSTGNSNTVENKTEERQDVVIEPNKVSDNDKNSDLNTNNKDVKEFESKITNRSKIDINNQNSKPEGQNLEFRNCDLCGMTFFKLEHYHKHVTKMHTVSTVHKCSRCGIECLGPKSLEAHMNTHKFEFRFKSPLKHKCYTCNISFPTRALKEKHLQIHRV